MKRAMDASDDSNKVARAVLKIGTHDGSFHCDEALACFMLRMTEQFRDAEVVRTRDPALLATLPIVVDVGGEYNPATHRYDHHQRSFTDAFDDKHDIRLSSAGLVYKHFGREVVASVLGAELAADAEVLELVYQRTYENFILALDAVDNGISQYPADVQPRYTVNTTLPSRVGRLNPEWNEEGIDMNARFAKAMEIAGEDFVACVRGIGCVWWPARSIVQNSFRKRHEVDASGQLLVLDRFCPWKEHLLEIEAENGAAGSVIYVLYGDASGSWRIQAVPDRVDSFSNRRPLPKAWQGIRDEALSQLTGIPGCVFIHANGFIGGHKNKEGALAMARLALTVQE